MKELLAGLKKIKGVQALVLLMFLCVLGALALGDMDDTQVQKTALEARLESVLSKIQGAGQVSVVIYTASETSAFSSAASSAPCGAVIVAQGAGDISVRLRLLSATQTLLSLPASSISVYEMEASP